MVIQHIKHPCFKFLKILELALLYLGVTHDDTFFLNQNFLIIVRPVIVANVEIGVLWGECSFEWVDNHDISSFFRGFDGDFFLLD